MPPKLTKSAKQALIVSHLRASGTCHTLKDLEKSLPAVASINAIQVKEFLQELADENEIRMEKIGSLNWYWCFAGEAKRERESRLRAVQSEVELVGKEVSELEALVRERKAAEERERVEDERVRVREAGGGGGGGIGYDREQERERLMLRKVELQEEIRHLQGKVTAVSGSSGGGGGGVVEEKSLSCVVEETEEFRRQALMWTENIYVLEGFVDRLTGGDREVLRALQRECYGEEEYVEGEGLREIFE
ncbi:putative GAJ protein [Aspergillus brunneoviolaceus CBS 621.78]|uniref:Meiotic nuclear division protein 1 n=1 Tax=Aspergillus brunneoviolaceus CBS 621.78 TaxID=1450534 RepID=A0ACD1GQG7_9EURO|nr:meiotic nuclear division protein 1 [Aspergillus brunneoviolaceus CBS 621.78]RAH51538.1 meiotic nuclear division protein 1 [Aspergillus brunneoviolaceus CBS 621.78]